MIFDIATAPHRNIYNLLIGLVNPRPIALVTTHDIHGNLNAAPFSAYNYLCTDPPIVAIGVANRPGDEIIPKDTAKNIRNTGEFVVNVVTEDIADKMNFCAIDFPPGVSEVELAGFTTAPSAKVSVPRLAQARAALECREHSTIEIGKSRIILGQVVSIFVDDRFIDPAGPYVKSEELHTIGRMNGLGTYVRTRDAFFHMPRSNYQQWQADQKPRA